MRLAVLVSGSGTNLQAILDAVCTGLLHAEVGLVLSNKPGVQSLARAEAAGVPAVVLSHRSFPTREAFDGEIVRELRLHRIDIVVLAGFVRIVTPVLLGAFPNRVVNIHPSLLPSFPGLDAQGQAFRAGVAVTGCTVHLVDGGMDSGAILAQAVVPVLADDDESRLSARILAEEHRLLPRVLEWFAAGLVSVHEDAAGVARVTVNGRARVAISPAFLQVFDP